MKAKRFSEEQMIGILKEWDAGAETKDLCRKHGVSDGTLYTGASRGQVDRIEKYYDKEMPPKDRLFG